MFSVTVKSKRMWSVRECHGKLKVSLYKSKQSLSCLCVCVYVSVPQISEDEDLTDLRVSTWLLRGSRMCNVAFVWTAMIPWINYFINALQFSKHCPPEPPQSREHQSQSLHTIATCAPEPITAEPTATPHLKKQAELYLQWCELDGILPAVRSRSVLCI